MSGLIVSKLFEKIPVKKNKVGNLLEFGGPTDQNIPMDMILKMTIHDHTPMEHFYRNL